MIECRRYPCQGSAITGRQPVTDRRFLHCARACRPPPASPPRSRDNTVDVIICHLNKIFFRRHGEGPSGTHCRLASKAGAETELVGLRKGAQKRSDMLIAYFEIVDSARSLRKVLISNAPVGVRDCPAELVMDYLKLQDGNAKHLRRFNYQTVEAEQTEMRSGAGQDGWPNIDSFLSLFKAQPVASMCKQLLLRARPSAGGAGGADWLPSSVTPQPLDRRQASESFEKRLLLEPLRKHYSRRPSAYQANDL
ncbi:hypothetical protein EVAR_35634_1 [Eumeta japonica]|uniref:Uncharacterized protein n=1 Tax=Eumeta variegata TaxID=151549 RepID=A0A4C1WEV1_EUMVA|nr:hypothetical protein EVAR_35634_1 [Eumeta japonica]